jgi:hypothetical protein
MRVPRTPTDLLNRRPREKHRAGAPARRRAEGRSEAPASPPPAPKTAGDDLRQERRMRESGGPDDRAHYRCSCGFAFDAPVSTSVACPHCGTGQAW